MPFRIVFAPEAEAQLTALYRYIRDKASPAIAERFTSAIVEYRESFDVFPQRGTSREDLRPGLRTIGFRRAVTISFAIDNEIVTIIGIFYGGQDFEAACKNAP